MRGILKTKLLLVAALCWCCAQAWASPPSKWWIEKNTPVALNVQAARDLRLLVKVLVKRGFDIESGEDWHGIPAAAYGEARTNHDFYVTKREMRDLLCPRRGGNSVVR